MGVPALFRWLSKKYPKIVSEVIEDQPQVIDDQEVPVDITKPNPNGLEYDNLYLDMNGIVHPCSHPEDRPPPETEEEMMMEIFKYTDRVFNMVRPRKLLMIAVDGVAPRAKMNQQRSRRFRSAQEAKEKDENNAEFIKMLKSQNGGSLEEGREEAITKKTWDSNQITPGTPFMHTLAVSLKWWCAYKINTDAGWHNVKVIISDASVPGEGEHKIMEFIRSQRSSPLHDPNTRHVLYGLDADLIMLGLATHEPHFHVLREDVFFQEKKARTCRLCNQKGHMAEECQGISRQKDGEFDEKDTAPALELCLPSQPFAFDLERALDDWVCMCFFVGNDFLPHLPSLDIRENGIDTLINIWRDSLPLMGGYLTKDGDLNLARCQSILDGLARKEDGIFRNRKQQEERREAGAKRRKLEEESRNSRRVSGRKSPDYNPLVPAAANAQSSLPLFAPSKGAVPEDVKRITHEMAVNRGAAYKADLANKSAAAALKSRLRDTTIDGDSNPTPSAGVNGASAGSSLENGVSTLGKRKADLLDEDSGTPGRNPPTGGESTSSKQEENESPPDTVRLWEAGYADRYYEQKFGADPKDIAFRNNVAAAYVEGLAWVLLYYYQGCPSWRWYYPYHYAPFAADFVDLDRMDVKFEQAAPLRPYEQLMGVLPAASNQAIPHCFRSLMEDPDSEIIDFYPEDFHVDLNGKKWAWQGVAILPFIDEKRLLDAMAKKYPLLSDDENNRNEKGKPVLIFSDQHRMFTDVASNFYSKRQGTPKFKLDPRKSEGLSGKVEKHPDYVPQSPLMFPLTQGGMPNLEDDHSVSVQFEIPESHHVHKSMLLNGVRLPRPALGPSDIEEVKSRGNRNGRGRGGGFPRGGGRGGRGGSFYNAEPRPNPFAAHLVPGFQPPPFNGSPRQPPRQQTWASNGQHNNFRDGRPGQRQNSGHHQPAYGPSFRDGNGGHRGSYAHGRDGPHREYDNGYRPPPANYRY